MRPEPTEVEPRTMKKKDTVGKGEGVSRICPIIRWIRNRVVLFERPGEMVW